MIVLAAWNLLQNSAPVTALVGTGDGARIHHVERPQGQRIPVAGPTIVIQGPETDHGHDFDGPDESMDGFVQVTCLGRNLTECLTLATAARAALEKRGVTGAGMNIHLSEVQGESAVPSDADAGAEVSTHGRVLQVRIFACAQ